MSKGWEVTKVAVGPGQIRKHRYRVEFPPFITLGKEEENKLALQAWLDGLTLENCKLVTIYQGFYFIFEVV